MTPRISASLARGPKFLIGRNAVKPLDDVETAKVGLDRHLFPLGKGRGDGEGAAEECLSLVHAPAGLGRYLGHLFQVPCLWGNHQIHVLGAADYPPGINRKATHHDELGLRSRQAPQELVEGRFAQFWRAAPVNRISLWLSAMPSARFTLIDRCASSRSRCLRTASAFAAGSESASSCPFMDRMLARGGDQAGHSSAAYLSSRPWRRCRGF